VAQQLRLAFAARAHVLESALGVAAHRDHVIPAHEDVELAHAQVFAAHIDGVQDEEERIPVLLDLRPLVAVARVLHRQLVQVELLLHRRELGIGRVAQGNPDEAVGTREVAADLARVDFRELAAVLVSDAGDKHGGR